MANPLEKFLNEHKANKNSPTHTRIGNGFLNIYGGSYYISEQDLDEFYELYFNDVFVNNNKNYLTEKQYGNCIAIDLDFKYRRDIKERQHTKETIENTIFIYCNVLRDNFFEFNKETNFDIFIFEKDNVNLNDEYFTKDGVHILINLKLEHNLQAILRERVMEQAEDINELPLMCKLEAVFDEVIAKGTTNWQLFGSQKPGNEAYKLKYGYNITFDESDREFMYKDLENLEINFELFKNYLYKIKITLLIN